MVSKPTPLHELATEFIRLFRDHAEPTGGYADAAARQLNGIIPVLTASRMVSWFEYLLAEEHLDCLRWRTPKKLRHFLIEAEVEGRYARSRPYDGPAGPFLPPADALSDRLAMLHRLSGSQITAQLLTPPVVYRAMRLDTPGLTQLAEDRDALEYAAETPFRPR